MFICVPAQNTERTLPGRHTIATFFRKRKLAARGTAYIKSGSQKSGLQAAAEVLPKPEHKLATSISPQLTENERKSKACTTRNPKQTGGSGNAHTQQKYLALLAGQASAQYFIQIALFLPKSKQIAPWFTLRRGRGSLWQGEGSLPKVRGSTGTATISPSSIISSALLHQSFGSQQAAVLGSFWRVL